MFCYINQVIENNRLIQKIIDRLIKKKKILVRCSPNSPTFQRKIVFFFTHTFINKVIMWSIVNTVQDILLITENKTSKSEMRNKSCVRCLLSFKKEKSE